MNQDLVIGFSFRLILAMGCLASLIDGQETAWDTSGKNRQSDSHTKTSNSGAVKVLTMGVKNSRPLCDGQDGVGCSVGVKILAAFEADELLTGWSLHIFPHIVIEVVRIASLNEKKSVNISISMSLPGAHPVLNQIHCSQRATVCVAPLSVFKPTKLVSYLASLLCCFACLWKPIFHTVTEAETGEMICENLDSADEAVSLNFALSGNEVYTGSLGKASDARSILPRV